MKRFLILLVFCLLFISAIAAAADTALTSKYCKQCGMDREAYARSRMLIVYSDDTTVGVCSLHCAAADMKQNKDKQVVSLLVADYVTKQLIDARTATWVVGGTEAGVMTSVAKWAFAREEDAENFVKENSGQVTQYEQVMSAAYAEVGDVKEMTSEHKEHKGHDMGQMGHDMAHMDMGPGAQMIYNPAFGEEVYHTHPAGMWMVNYKFMHVNMNGLRAGTHDVDRSDVGFMRDSRYEYMMIPTKMRMDMHMVMAMYGITDRLTVMAMTNYQAMKMDMLMDMGPMKPIAQEPPMSTSGFGDTEIRAMYKISKNFVGSLGLNLPTGSTEEKISMMHTEYRAPYDMQPGAGTYDLKPALTYTGLSSDAKWNWGAQAMYVFHPGKNDNGWSYGDSFRATGWVQRAFGPANSWLRFSYNNTGRIRGEDPEIDEMIHPETGMGAPTPDADPDNYGGQRLDGAAGIGFGKGPFSFGVEGGIPLYQKLNGLQLKTDWFLTAAFQVMF